MRYPSILMDYMIVKHCEVVSQQGGGRRTQVDDVDATASGSFQVHENLLEYVLPYQVPVNDRHSFGISWSTTTTTTTTTTTIVEEELLELPVPPEPLVLTDVYRNAPDPKTGQAQAGISFQWPGSSVHFCPRKQIYFVAGSYTFLGPFSRTVSVTLARYRANPNLFSLVVDYANDLSCLLLTCPDFERYVCGFGMGRPLSWGASVGIPSFYDATEVFQSDCDQASLEEPFASEPQSGNSGSLPAVVVFSSQTEADHFLMIEANNRVHQWTLVNVAEQICVYTRSSEDHHWDRRIGIRVTGYSTFRYGFVYFNSKEFHTALGLECPAGRPGGSSLDPLTDVIKNEEFGWREIVALGEEAIRAKKVWPRVFAHLVEPSLLAERRRPFLLVLRGTHRLNQLKDGIEWATSSIVLKSHFLKCTPRVRLLRPRPLPPRLTDPSQGAVRCMRKMYFCVNNFTFVWYFLSAV